MASLEPKRQAHWRRGRRAHRYGRVPALRLLRWLKGGDLPLLRGSLRAVRRLGSELRSSSAASLQLSRRSRLQRWQRRRRQLRSLRRLQNWLRQREIQAAEAKQQREREEGEAPGEPAGPPAASPEEQRLEEADRRREEESVGRLTGRLRRLEELLRHSPLAEGSKPSATAGPPPLEKRRRAVARATLALLRRPHPTQRRRLTGALRRWRRQLERERCAELLQHPLLQGPENWRRQQALQHSWQQELRRDYRQRQQQLEEHRRQRSRGLRPSGLGHPGGRVPRRSPRQLLERWSTRLQSGGKDGFEFFLPHSPSAKGGLFRWNHLLEYWNSGELPHQYRQRRYGAADQQSAAAPPTPLPTGEQQRNRRRLVEYLELELQLLEAQLELGGETPGRLRQLKNRYPLDHQGRLLYPLPRPLPRQPDNPNPFFLPENSVPHRRRRGAGIPPAPTGPSNPPRGPFRRGGGRGG